jgi:spermidine/putrescine transport system permease protein
MVLPFWTSYIVRSYAWLLVLSPDGVINQSLMLLGVTRAPLRLAYNNAATVVGFVHFFIMLLTLTIYSNLSQLSPRYLLAASDLGAGWVQSFWYVLLPLSLPGIVSGAFMTFVLCIGDYITPQILGGDRTLVMPQEMFFQISRNADFSMASAMAVILMAVMALAYLASSRWLRMDRL